MASTTRIALVGNPNSGKSSLFNRLTGLQQKTGNYPGVTVDKKIGTLTFKQAPAVALVDLPGTYSLFPLSDDERVVAQYFSTTHKDQLPDGIVYVADITQADRHLLLFSQLYDLGLPMILVLNMADRSNIDGWKPPVQELEQRLGVPVIIASSKTGQGIDEVVRQLENWPPAREDMPLTTFDLTPQAALTKAIQASYPDTSPYQAKLLAHHHAWLPELSETERQNIADAVQTHEFTDLTAQVEETMQRFDRLKPITALLQPPAASTPTTTSDRIDRWLTHPLWGGLVFTGVLFLLFQGVYAWSEAPMGWIESGFEQLAKFTTTILPESWISDLITQGILAGLGGVLVFIPPIAILFLLISFLEEIGYMARAAALMDGIMQRFGLNGRSVVALVSGHACAIPAVMSTRTIANWKERLITILVTPFTGCSARIPIYVVLIGFVVPKQTVLGAFNLQGIAFMGLYLLGILGALLFALVLKYVLKTGETSYLMLELPAYRSPNWRMIGINVYEKVKTFVLEAGKVILVISIILWALASYGPQKRMDRMEQEAKHLIESQQLDEATAELVRTSKQLEGSYAGLLGKTIEPVIQPLGFDWKMGIALITSFAAREVFVGTMATIYSMDSESGEYAIRDRLREERDPLTGAKVYDMATSLSLLIFYVFAMMCMSTLAVVYRETKSWKWPLIQFFGMTTLAYLASLFVFQMLSH